MNKPHVHPCQTMAEVRRHIDALDARIVPLLAERSGYVAQAARIKQHADQVHDRDRIGIEHTDRARRAGFRVVYAPEAVVEATYRAMIDGFIEFERGEFARLHRKD